MAPLLDVVNDRNEKVGELELPDALLTAPVRPDLLHAVVVMQRANRRQGTASTRGRSEVSGGGRKPWRQKGTGRARAGSSRSPLWRHGGTVFGPKPRDYGTRVPRQVRRRALQGALASQVRADRVRVVEGFGLERPNTKVLAAVLKGLGASGNVLLVLHAMEDVVMRSARNLPRVRLLAAAGLNAYDLLWADTVVFTREALGKVTEALAT